MNRILPSGLVEVSTLEGGEMDASLPHREAPAFDMSQLIEQDHVDFHGEAEATTMNLTPVGSDIGKTAFPTVAADSGELAER